MMQVDEDYRDSIVALSLDLFFIFIQGILCISGGFLLNADDN